MHGTISGAINKFGLIFVIQGGPMMPADDLTISELALTKNAEHNYTEFMV